jgi:hypothetical protein
MSDQNVQLHDDEVRFLQTLSTLLFDRDPQGRLHVREDKARAMAEALVEDPTRRDRFTQVLQDAVVARNSAEPTRAAEGIAAGAPVVIP